MVEAKSRAKLSPLLQPALAAVQDATNAMTPEQLLWHPEGKWSSGEILEHLALAYSLTTERMKRLRDQDLLKPRRPRFQEWVGRVLVLKFGYIPPGRKAPDALLPRGMEPADARVRIEESLDQLDQIMNDCERRFGGEQAVLEHTLLGPLSISAWRRFHCVHTLHHMKQIRRLRALFSRSGL